MEYLDGVLICACMYVPCVTEGAQRLCRGGDCSSGCSGCDDVTEEDSWLSTGEAGSGSGSGSARAISAWACRCVDEWREMPGMEVRERAGGEGSASNASEEGEEDDEGRSVDDWLWGESVTSKEGEEEEGDDGVLTRCWRAEDPPAEQEVVSPAGMSGPCPRSCSPVPSVFLSSGGAPSFCVLLAVASSCPAGL